MTPNKKWRIGLYYIIILGGVMMIAITVGICGVLLYKRFGVIENVSIGYTTALITVLSTSVVITSLAILLLGKNIIKPVTRLSELSQRVAKGDFSATIDEKSYIDEIQIVLDSFNSMVNELGTNEALSNDFISNVSHELKTPISAIEGYAALLQDDTVSEEEKREFIGKILYNTSRLSELTGNILLLSKLETQNIVSDKAYYDLDEQIRCSVLSLETKWSEKNINLDINLENVRYFGSEGLLSTVWTNVIGNAVKYSDEGSEISITLKQSNGEAVAVIADNGIGMSEETIKHVFEKFYQGDLSRRSAGNGLGLTMVKRILDLCGGSIEIKSELGAGTEFTIILPLTSEE